METYNEWLAHHGILGMRWGKKNGPPYPLSTSQMSSLEKKKNYKSLKSDKKINPYEKSRLSYEIAKKINTNTNNGKRYSTPEEARRIVSDHADRYIDDFLGKYGDKNVSKIEGIGVSARRSLRNDIESIFTSTSKQTRSQMAKTLDIYELDFLEAIQNFNLPKDVKLKEYDTYLDATTYNDYATDEMYERLKKYRE